MVGSWYDVNLFRLSLHYKKERMIKALFFDIDGTLVYITHRIPRSTGRIVGESQKERIENLYLYGRPLTFISIISMISKALLMDILLRMVLIYWSEIR